MAGHSTTDAPVIGPLVCFPTKLQCKGMSLVGSANFETPRPSEENLVDLWRSTPARLLPVVLREEPSCGFLGSTELTKTEISSLPEAAVTIHRSVYLNRYSLALSH